MHSLSLFQVLSCRRAQQGFSMIELLVALLVLSIGLLGVAALMATSMRNSQSANYRTQATNLAYEITDAVRANLINAGRYHSDVFSDPTVACPAAARPAQLYPAATNPHVLDLQRWYSDLCYQLPNGAGRVQVVPSPQIVAATGQTYRTYTVNVDICWSDDRTEAAANDCDNATDGPDTVIRITSAL